MRSGSASSEFSRGLIDRSGYESEEFAEGYDRHRLTPPRALLKILTLVAQAERPRLVVDLGAGTGLSTRVWAGHAEQIVGVEANARMLEWAQRVTQEPNVSYVEAFASDTGLCAGSADLVTCAQAFHWMEPTTVLREAWRVLRSGGVFAAYDYDVPPAIHPEIDPAFAAHSPRGDGRASASGFGRAPPLGRRSNTWSASGKAGFSASLGRLSATASRRLTRRASSGWPKAWADRAPSSVTRRRRSRKRS